ncbi:MULTISPECIES: PadR family transcriptional regulator [unclassified Leptolyngbya]|uniref:PadR family transcriptional regulator n=1 Tax=unclassified Leptolyngbya TaxID=2650499 RepID=UPI001683EFF6|nr:MULTISPECIES: PadR family transcriptional regulator [unclassified Leptolyngbya]MBD1909015.1 PadR family transcriptional regulator [Leptolyngbya sp. FACHB-8]MBD2158085.1 PadR family transcriptional regulator [Leptolyngbya sp. FACHB-16]
MSLAYVILGLLQQQERTGYDLKTECFNQCIAHLWSADQAQIYRTLEKLEGQGWIACTVEIQSDRPNRKVYCITKAGQTELQQWLQTHQPPPILREPLLVQLHFAAQLPDDAIVQLLEQELEARQRKLEECDAIALPSLTTPGISREQKMQRLALELVQRREQAYVEWLRGAIATLQHQPE